MAWCIIFLVINDIPVCRCSTVCSPTEGHIDWFQILTITSKVVKKHLCADLCVYTNLHVLWVNASRSMVAGPYGKDMFIFARNQQIVFQSGWTLLHSHQQWMRGFVTALSLPKFDDASVLDLSFSSKCVVVFHCFNLNFPDEIWWEHHFYTLSFIYIFFFLVRWLWRPLILFLARLKL